MPVLSANAKAIVALIMAILTILDQIFGVKFGISQEVVTVILAALTPILVWLIPNTEKALTT